MPFICFSAYFCIRFLTKKIDDLLTLFTNYPQMLGQNLYSAIQKRWFTYGWLFDSLYLSEKDQDRFQGNSRGDLKTPYAKFSKRCYFSIMYPIFLI